LLPVFDDLGGPIARLRARGLIGVPPGSHPGTRVAGWNATVTPEPPKQDTRPKYTPKDIIDAQQQMAEYFQSRPTAPMYGGTPASGWAATAANVGNPALGMYMFMQGQRQREANERLSADVAQRAAGATSLQDYITAHSGGGPEDRARAAQLQGQNLLAVEQQRRTQELQDRERQRRQSEIQAVYGTAPPSTSIQPAPTQAQPPSPLPVTPRVVQTRPVDETTPMGPRLPSDVAPSPVQAPPAPIQTPRAPEVRQWIGTEAEPDFQGTPLARGVQPAAPPAPAAPSQQEPTVEIGRFRLPMSEARRRAAVGKALGIDVKPIEDAINFAEEGPKARARTAGELQAKREGQTASRQGATRDIAGGLAELASLPERYGGEWGTFGSGIGPLQGDESDLGWNVPAQIARGVARGMGSAYTSLPGVPGPTGSSPAEVRRAIVGAQNTLASILKPLIRGPGEGAWSDADQALLNSIIGDLRLANDRDSYMRELNNVRSRIINTFGIDLPAISGGNAGTPPPGTRLRYNPATGELE
jgi:hypothetical protein